MADLRRNLNPPQAQSRVGICEPLPGLTEFEALQMIQKALGRLPEVTIKQILNQAGNSIRRLTKLFDPLKGLQELNRDRGIEELMAVARDTLLVLAR